MSLLLLFGGALADLDSAITFTGSATLTPVGSVQVSGAVVFGGTGTVSPGGVRNTTGAVAFSGSATLTPAGAVTEVARGLRFTLTSSFRPTARTIGAAYRVVVVDRTGARIAELDNADLSGVAWELNGPGSVDFSLGVTDPKALAAIPLETEVQVWRGNSLLWWGPLVRPQANAREVSFQAQGLLWYFSRRNFGKADRTNYIPNGDFEDGMAGWDIGFSHANEPAAGRNPSHWLASISTERAVTGTRSLYLEQVASGQPKYGFTARQTFEWEVDPVASPEGDVWTLAAYCWIPSATYRGPRLDRGGIRIVRSSTTETIDIGADDGSVPPTPQFVELESAEANIDDYTPQDRWVRLTAILEQRPTGEPETITVGLRCPDGAIFWDRVSLTLTESTRFYGIDQALIAKGIVEHLQDAAYDKSDLLIGTNTPLTGVVRDRVYPHDEHQNGLEQLSTFTQLDDGMDISVEITPTTRTFTTWFPEKGFLRDDVVLELGRNIEDFTWAFDGTVASSQVIALGVGDDSSREEGWANDLSLFDGVSFEQVFVSSDAIGSVSVLDNLAAERLRLLTNPTILEVTTYQGSGDLIGVLQTGDRVPVRIDRGYVQVDGIYRVVRIGLDTKTETLSLTLNVV